MSAWELPTTVEVAGRSFAIRSDFRAVLDALAALTDPDLTQQALAEVLTEWGGQDITIRFAASGGLEQLVRLLMPYIDKEKARRGARLVVGGN